MTTATKEAPKKIKATEVENKPKKQSIYQVLSSIDVSKHVEQKMGLNYLSWSWAWGLLNEHFDYVRKTPTQFTLHDVNGNEYLSNYNNTPAGAYVEVTLTINDQSQTETLPVMDNKNKSVMNPNQMQVNKAIQRCFVKAAALFGLGLNIYAGEDLPMTKPKATKAEIKALDEKIITYSGLRKQDPEKMYNWALKKLDVDDLSKADKQGVETISAKLDELTKAVQAMNGGQQ